MKTSILSTAQADRATSIASELKSGPSQEYAPTLFDRFPSKLASIEQAPEPLRSAVRNRLSSYDDIRLIVFGPASRLFGKRSPATLLVVTVRDWLMASDAADGQAEVVRCDFSNTLMVELTTVLLRGRLRVDFAQRGRAHSICAEFNTVMEEYYLEATQLLLDGMDGAATVASGDMSSNHALDALPLKFQNAMLRYQPAGQRLVDAVRWPAIWVGKCPWRQHEIVPESLLALTDRDIVFISEEKSSARSPAGQQAEHGNIVIYCPLSRLIHVRLRAHDSFDALDLHLGAPQGGEKVKIPFPCEHKSVVSAFVQRLEEELGRHAK